MLANKINSHQVFPIFHYFLNVILIVKNSFPRGSRREQLWWKKVPDGKGQRGSQWQPHCSRRELSRCYSGFSFARRFLGLAASASFCFASSAAISSVRAR